MKTVEPSALDKCEEYALTFGNNDHFQQAQCWDSLFRFGFYYREAWNWREDWPDTTFC
jgi:hypothetical protein